MGEELHEILQNSGNEGYTENKQSEGSNAEIDKEVDGDQRKCTSGERRWQKKIGS